MKKTVRFIKTRRLMMGATLCALTMASACKEGDERTDTRPNFVTIVLDDMGYSDIGPYGSEIETPTIDELAESGIVFTNFYAHATSTPARGMLFTGKSNHAAGVGNMEGWVPFRREQTYKVGYEGELSRDVYSFPEILADNGYHNMFTGKWDLGSKAGHIPSQRGFHQARSVMLMGGDTHFSEEDGTIITSHQLSKYKKKNRQSWYNDNGKEMIKFEREFYSVDYYTDMALDMLANRDTTKPFYLNITHIAPHAPVQAPDDMIEKYLDTYSVGWDVIRKARFDKQKELGLVPTDRALPDRTEGAEAWSSLDQTEKDKQTKIMAAYAGMIDKIDQNVKRVVDYLKANDLYENTVIFIVSDNGAAYKMTWSNNPERKAWVTSNFNIGDDYDTLAGRRSFVGNGPGWAMVNNTPWNFFKGDFYEGGIHVSGMVHYPKSAISGIYSNRITSIMDIAPTILEMADITYPATHNGRANEPMAGISFADLIERGASLNADGRVLTWELDGGKAVRSGDWKLSTRWHNDTNCWSDSWHLYDLGTDPYERTDLVDDRTDIVDELNSYYEAFAEANNVVEVPACRPLVP